MLNELKVKEAINELLLDFERELVTKDEAIRLLRTLINFDVIGAEYASDALDEVLRTTEKGAA